MAPVPYRENSSEAFAGGFANGQSKGAMARLLSKFVAGTHVLLAQHEPSRPTTLAQTRRRTQHAWPVDKRHCDVARSRPKMAATLECLEKTIALSLTAKLLRFAALRPLFVLFCWLVVGAQMELLPHYLVVSAQSSSKSV